MTSIPSLSNSWKTRAPRCSNGWERCRIRKRISIFCRSFGVGSPQDPGALAYYDRAVRGVARIVIFAPESFSFSFYDPGQGWEPELQGTLTHEYTHLVNNASFTPIARMTDWMV